MREHDKRSTNVGLNFSNMHGMLREISDAAALNVRVYARCVCEVEALHLYSPQVFHI